jgi:hypothetical protein
MTQTISLFVGPLWVGRKPWKLPGGRLPGSRVFKEGKGGYVVRFFAGRLQQIKIIEEIGE